MQYKQLHALPPHLHMESGITGDMVDLTSPPHPHSHLPCLNWRASPLGAFPTQVPTVSFCFVLFLFLFVCLFVFREGSTHWDKEKQSQISYTTPCNCIVGHGARIEGIQVFADHTYRWKQMQTKSSHDLYVPCCCAVFYACLSSSSDCRSYVYLTNHC